MFRFDENLESLELILLADEYHFHSCNIPGNLLRYYRKRIFPGVKWFPSRNCFKNYHYEFSHWWREGEGGHSTSTTDILRGKVSTLHRVMLTKVYGPQLCASSINDTNNKHNDQALNTKIYHIQEGKTIPFVIVIVIVWTQFFQVSTNVCCHV